jgi:hypothetical protein
MDRREGMKPVGKIYFIQEHIQAVYYHGGIGNTDIEKVLLQQGATPILFPFHFDFSVKAKCYRLLYLIRTWFALEAGAIVVFQHPMYAGLNKLLIRLLRFRRKVTVVCITAEINGLKYADNKILEQERHYFNGFRYFIVHNPRMQAWLDKEVPGRFSAILNFFDFLATPATQQRNVAYTVAYAGNLEESGFLRKLPQLTPSSGKLVFHLYGKPKPADVAFSDRIVYKGVVEPYQLPGVIEGAFGLVWDGEEVDKVDGHFGHYMEYISHHKVSLYILSGMPLIIYENAGTAALVKEYGIGFTVRNLTEIEEKINTITEADYRRMCDNMRSLAKQISSGACLTNALRIITDQINS